MKFRAHQIGELIGIFLLLASVATQMFYLEPLKRDIEWRLAAFSTQQSAQVQMKALYDNHVELLRFLKAPENLVAGAEANREKSLDRFKTADANISDFMIEKERVEHYLEIIVIVLFAIGTLLAGLGRAIEMRVHNRD